MPSRGPEVDRLPHGPHGLSRDQVLASQQTRILDALMVAVGTHGYHHTTVAHVTSAARVSRSAFYAQFADKRAAFLAAYTAWGERFFADLVSAASGASSLRGIVSACGEVLVGRARTEPEASRAFILEIHATGEHGTAARERMLGIGQGLFDQLAAAPHTERRVETTSTVEPVPLLGLAVIGASFELCAHALRHPGERTLDDVRSAIEATWLLALGVPRA